jgi:hypothetical protein
VIFGALPDNDLRNSTSNAMSEKLCHRSADVSGVNPSGPDSGMPRKQNVTTSSSVVCEPSCMYGPVSAMLRRLGVRNRKRSSFLPVTSARWDLCGGRRVTGVPTANAGRRAGGTGRRNRRREGRDDRVPQRCVYLTERRWVLSLEGLPAPNSFEDSAFRSIGLWPVLTGSAAGRCDHNLAVS